MSLEVKSLLQVSRIRIVLKLFEGWEGWRANLTIAIILGISILSLMESLGENKI